MRPEQVVAMSDVGSSRLISAEEWEKSRFQWLEAARRDPDLSDRECRIAHVLALDFANHETGQCEPSNAQIAVRSGRSVDTVKRSIAALVKGGWIVRQPGQHTGKPSSYRFVRRASVVKLYPSQGGSKRGANEPREGGRSAPRGGQISPKRGADQPQKRGANEPREGGKWAPKEGCKSAPSWAERGANEPREGGKWAPAYYIAKPYLNHRAGASAPVPVLLSENPSVAKLATAAADAFRIGLRNALDDLLPIVVGHIAAAGLLTEAELQEAGFEFSEKGGADGSR